jgi:hypothetical protein
MHAVRADCPSTVHQPCRLAPGTMEKNNMESGIGDTQAGSIRRYGHFWAAYDDAGQLVCVTVYKKGAAEVVRRIQGIRREKPSSLNPIT